MFDRTLKELRVLDKQVLLGQLLLLLVAIVSLLWGAKTGTVLKRDYGRLALFFEQFFPLILSISVSEIVDQDKKNGVLELLYRCATPKKMIYGTRLLMIFTLNLLQVMALVLVAKIGYRDLSVFKLILATYSNFALFAAIVLTAYYFFKQYDFALFAAVLYVAVNAGAAKIMAQSPWQIVYPLNLSLNPGITDGILILSKFSLLGLGLALIGIFLTRIENPEWIV